MPTSLLDFKERFRESVLSFLWGQWSALGVAGQASAKDNRVIDPEALILATTTFGRLDPRLFDEVLDWLSKEGSTINLQRLKNLQTAHRFGNPGVLAAMAATIGSRPPHLKWRLYAQELAGTDPEGHARKAKPAYTIPEVADTLFPGVPLTGEPDSEFLRLGWLRGLLELRGLSNTPDPNRPANFLFKLRALFGLQARAEIMACLLGSEAKHPAQVAELTGYFPRTVQLALNEMARSGHIFAEREAREKYFRLWKADWGFLTRPPGHFPRWINWSPLFAALDALREKLDTPGLETAPPSLQAIELRKMSDLIGHAVRHSGLEWQFHKLPELTGEAFVEAFLEDIIELLT